MSVLVVGTVALDTVQTPFGHVQAALGGSATYSATAASFFSQTKLVAIVGKDFPEKFIAQLRSRQIDTAGLEIRTGKTFHWSGLYTEDLSNPQTLKTELNLLAQFDPQLPENYTKEKFVFLANVDPEIQLKVLNQLKQPEIVVCDTMNYWIENKIEMLKKVIQKSDILVVNDAESRLLTNESNLLKAAKLLLSLGPKLVIIKRGEFGCALFSDSLVFTLPAYLLEVVRDPTGAGDTFAGGFLGYLSSRSKITDSVLKEAVAYGTIMASYVVDDFSLNRMEKLTKTEIEERLEKFRCLTTF